MKYFPVFFDLHEQNVLLVGGGAVAERKIRLLLKAGARVHVIARKLTPNVEKWKKRRELIHVGPNFQPGLLPGMRLVFAATSDRRLNRDVFEAAERFGIPVNVVDDQQYCRFISPAVVDRSPIQIAVSTGGAAPVLARRIRGWLESLLPRGLGNVAVAAGRVRPLVKRLLPGESRRRFWEEQLSDSKLVQWSTASEEQIGTAMKRALKRRAKSAGNVGPVGRVYLVGAGPGRADLLTLRASEVLGQADVVLHDRLVSDEILDRVRRDAELIDVGKRSGHHQHSQQEIHRMILAETSRGRNVVRLKGGDAFVFGRGGEELEMLKAHGIECEVVPGITAATGCAAYAGIPLTHRDFAQALTLVTGHLHGQSDSHGVDWAGIAGSGKTVAVYMGVKQAATIRKALLAAGISPRLPAALVADGTRDNQQVFHGTIATLPALAKRIRGGAPGLFIIGQVAALGSNLTWFSTQDTLDTAA